MTSVLADDAELLVGVREPRVRVVPPGASRSQGADAIELAASAGLHLDGWQQDDLCDLLAEESPGRWAQLESGLVVPRQNGKGGVAEAIILLALFVLRLPLVLYTAHEFKTARELFLRVVGRIEDTPELDGLVSKVSWSHGDEGIELRKGAGGCRLRIIARSKGSGRGFSAPLSILDEAMFVTSEQVAALMPTMSAMPNPLLVVLGSAGFSTSSYLHRLRRRATSGRPGRVCWLDHSVDPAEWGGRDSLLWQEARAEPRVWAFGNPALGIRLGLEILEMEFAAMEPEVFDRERLGVFDEEPASAAPDAVLDLGHWVERGDPGSGRGWPEVGSVVEVGRKGSTSAIALGGMREDGRRHVELLDYRPGTAWLDDRRAELEDLYPDAVWCIDTSGPSVMLRSRDEWEELPAKAVSEAFAELVAGVVEDRLVWRCAEVDAPAVLTAAEHGVAHTTVDGVQRWSRTKSGVDITPLIALTFAGWAGEYLAVNGDPLRAIR